MSAKTGGVFGGGGGGGNSDVYLGIINRLQSLLSDRLSAERAPHGKICHLVALIFGLPYFPVIQDVIAPRLDYWHHRSEINIDFFCIGFFGGRSVPVQKNFDERDFVRAVLLFEERSKWRYSGETDLVLLNAIYDPHTKKAMLDFSTVLTITLERAIEDKAISSLPIFLEQLIHWAKEYDGAHPTWDFSDSRGLRLAGDALKKFLISLLPGKIGENVVKAFHFYTKDLSISENTPR